MQIFRSSSHVLGGAFLIAGTTIGIGMLGLPVATAAGGFLPAVALYLICWVFMLCTGLLMLEICIWMPKEANMITMASKLLGIPGKVLCWIVYLFFFLAIMIAHIASGGHIFQDIFGGYLPDWLWTIVYVGIFVPFVYHGTLSVDRFNLILMTGLILAYLLFVFTSIPFVDTTLLRHRDWSKAWLALPVLFTAFGYQAILPTLMNYMDRNVKKVRLSIFIGTAIPLIIYLLWEFLILGIVPLEGPNSLTEAALLGQTAVTPLKAITQHGYLFLIGKAFAFFTMTASYLVISLAYMDFLADGFNWKKTTTTKTWLALIVFLPPTLIALSYPTIFLTALGYAGGFACAILFGLFPPLMVWVGRHFCHYQDDSRQLFGGRYILTVLILFVLFEVMIEIISQFLSR
ncbi:MAG: tyrosine transporter [Simkania sp.]|nr:tyrosine transporter [Simkania sp.]